MRAHPHCPHCGSTDVRPSHCRGPAELIRSWAGLCFLRCRDCATRFPTRLWRWDLLPYAKCPKCHGLALRDWQEKYYLPPWYKRALRLLGAREQRCEACRHNFLSFRRRWNPGTASRAAPKENGSK